LPRTGDSNIQFLQMADKAEKDSGILNRTGENSQTGGTGSNIANSYPLLQRFVIGNGIDGSLDFVIQSPEGG
jgi:hypothetical protein